MKRLRPASAAHALMLAGAFAPSSATAADCAPVTWEPPRAPERIRVATRTEVALFVDGALVPVAGTTTRRARSTVFRPKWPLVPGIRYRLRWTADCEASYDVPPPANTQARPLQIYPKASRLPENVLRFYVYFSRPMAEGRFTAHVRLTHVESGRNLSGVLFDNIYELWSADRKRITLLVDPGRVKTGLGANQRQGRAFVPGQTYALTVLSSWTTIDGHPLSQGLTKTFKATAQDRQPVIPRRWQWKLPAAGTRKPVRIDFLEPVDHVSVGHFLRIQAPDGSLLEGRWRMGLDDRSADWTPAEPWSKPVKDHRIRVHGRFEDIAGNNLNAAFDHQVGALPDTSEDRVVTIRFGGEMHSVSGPSNSP